MTVIKRVAYSYNSMLEEPFFLDVLSQQEGRVVVDFHGTFKKKAEFDQAINKLLPLLTNEEKENNQDESRKNQTSNE